MKINKFLESGFSYLLSGTQVAFDGLSSARQIVDFTFAPWAKYAACGATIVEGEIYRKNIVEGFSRFNLLSKKSLWEFLIIEKFESDLEKNTICEKKIKEKIINFLIKIKEYPEGSYLLNDQEENDLDSCILETKNSPLTEAHREKTYKIFGALKKARAEDSRFILQKHIAEFEEINKQWEDLIEAKKLNCPFLINYNANLEYLKQSKASHENGPYVAQVEKNLKILKKQLIKAVVQKENCQYLMGTILNAELVNIIKNEVSEKAKKLWFLRFGMLFSIGVGLCTGIITFYTFPLVLTTLGLSLGIVSAIIWPLAILAAISYTILIYNTITDLILNETLSKWWKKLNLEIEHTYEQLNIFKYCFLIIGKSISQFFGKLINWFKLQEQENYFSYALRMILSAAVLVFGIIASLTTGYTAFIQLQDYVTFSMCIITALPLMLSDLLFTLKNSFDTLGLLTGISINNLFNPVKQFYQDFKSQLKKENFLQCSLHMLRLPLKLMLSVLKLFIFLSHVIFTSVASDRFFNFPCWLTVFFAAGSELLTDICPLFGNKQGEHHDHGGIFNLINKIIFILPATLLGILNCLFSQLNRWTDSASLVLDFKEAIKQEWQQFDIIHKHDPLTNEMSSSNEAARELPEEVAIQKAIHICDKQINRLKKGFFNSELADNKVLIFENYKQRLQQKNGNQNNNNKLEDSERNTLGEYRFFKREGKTKSIQKIEKIERLISFCRKNG
jgi:hypothetical protein